MSLCSVTTRFGSYWKKQLCIAKDARRVDILCFRIYLSYRLLDGTSRFKELHNIIKEAKAKLETEVGPVNGSSTVMARGIVSRLSVAGAVQSLCSLAIKKADEWLAKKYSAVPNCKGTFQILGKELALEIILYYDVPCSFFTTMPWVQALKPRLLKTEGLLNFLFCGTYHVGALLIASDIYNIR